LNGNLGGRVAAHQLCNTEFSGAHMCHASEYVLSGSITVPPAAGAWIDPSVAPDDTTTYGGATYFGRQVGGADCSNWTTNNVNYYAPHVDPNGGISNSNNCAALRSVACCNGVSKVKFMGVTASFAPMTGRVQMNQACNTQYAGSHMCHAAEYLRASSTTVIPAQGAWIDPSVDFTGSTSYGGSPLFGRQQGGADCSNWTTTNVNYYAPHVDPNGGVTNSGNCSSQRYVACCM
jgi:hypothetical protein